MTTTRGELRLLVLVAFLCLAPCASQAQHEAHHPPAGTPANAAPAPVMNGAAAPGAPAMGEGKMGPPAGAPPGGMGGGMEAMMGAMMSPKPAPTTPIYSTLMTLPALTPETRAAIDALAGQQTTEGMSRLAKASDALDRATRAGDDAAMRQAVVLMRDGLDELEAGLAARRVLSEGKAPRNLALDWFKRELSLASPVVGAQAPGLLGLSLFHLFTMGLLIAFAIAMLALYFVKMRRAAALFRRLEPSATSPPPGSAPPLDGGPKPGPAPGGKPPPRGKPPGGQPPPGGKPPPRDPPAGAAPAPPEEPAVDADKPPDSEARAPAAPASASAAPLTAKWRGQLRVGSIAHETPSVITLRLLRAQGDGALPFSFVPGQFLNVAFGIGGARMNRSYSISSSPDERNFVELTVKREPRGAISRHIHDLIKVGDSIAAAGPVGKFTFDGSGVDSIVLIAAGVGITPLMSVMRTLTTRAWAGDIYFVYSCRARSDFIFAKPLAALMHQNPRLHVAVTLSKPDQEWLGHRGRITRELLAKTVPGLASKRVHLCGPLAMMDATKALLAELGVPAAQIRTEAFGAVRPAPAAPGTPAPPAQAATGPLVTFSKNGQAARIHDDQTILELSEELGIPIDSSCRVGTCGVCKVHLAAGKVDMAVQDALDGDDKKAGVILACQAKPTIDATVEA